MSAKRRKRAGAKASPGPHPAKDAYQAGPGVVVTLSYDVFDAEGELLGGSDGERSVLFGFGEIWPPVEQALEGLWPGDRKTIRLKAKDAFGERDPTAVLEFEPTEFPPDVAPGDSFEAEGEDGTVVVLRVLDVLEDRVVVDQNHPLAGQPVRIEVEVRATRLASSEELDAAAARLDEGAGGAQTPLIPAERLLRGPSRG